MTNEDHASDQGPSGDTPGATATEHGARELVRQPPPSDPAGQTPDGAGAADAGPMAAGPSLERRPSRLSQRIHSRLALTLTLGVTGGLLLLGLVTYVLAEARGLFINLVVALFLSFGLEPAVKWLHERGVPRGPATLLVFVAAFLLFIGFFAAMVPPIVDQVTNLVANRNTILNGLIRNAGQLPGELGTQVSDWLNNLRDDLPTRVPQLAVTAGRGVLDFGATVVGSLFNLLTIALFTFYLTADAPKLRRVLSSRMRPEAQGEFLRLWETAVEKTGGYVYSRMLIAIASTLFHATVFLVIGLDYAIALGVWVGVVSSVVPVVGTYLAGILPVVIALAGSATDAVWVMASVAVYQQVENYLIAPRITAHTLSLHPAVAFASVLLGAMLLGVVGALLAIPAVAIIASLLSANGQRHEVVDHAMTRRGREEHEQDDG